MKFVSNTPKTASVVQIVPTVSESDRPVARLGVEGGRDISQVGPDMFVTLSKCFSNIF